MSNEITPWELETEWLIHSSVKNSVPRGDMGNFVCDTVRESMDLTALFAAAEDDNKPPHHPAMMVALLIFSYRQGIFSSRRIAESCVCRIDFMALTAVSRLRPAEVASFVAEHRARLKPLFVQFLRLCKQLALPLPDGLDEDADADRTSLSFGSAHAAFEATAERWLDKARLADEDDAASRQRVDDSALPSWFDDERKRLRKLAAARLVLEREDEAKLEAERLLAEDDSELHDNALDDYPEYSDETASIAPAHRPRELSARAQRAAGRRAAHREEPRPDKPIAAAKATARPRRREVSKAHRPSSSESHNLPEQSSHERPASRRQRREQTDEPVPRVQDPPKVRPRRGQRRASPSHNEANELAGLTTDPDARMLMLRIVVATALADGHVVKVEQRRIDQFVRALRLDHNERMEIQAMIRDGRLPEMPTAEELPDYDLKLTIFQQAAIMALADGVVHPAERQYLRRLAHTFDLDIEDAKDALRAANQVTGH